jgi:hypothetical protein
VRLEAKLASPTALARSVASDLDGLAYDTSLTAASDQRTVEILVRAGKRWQYVAAYGLGRDGRATTPGGTAPPAALAKAYGTLLGLPIPGAAPWVPEKVEVLLWPFGAAREASAPWPSTVPKPQRGFLAPDGGVYKHVVAGVHEAALRAHMSSLGPSQATALDGQKWTMDVRPLVPDEDILRRVVTCGRQHRVAASRNSPPPTCT